MIVSEGAADTRIAWLEKFDCSSDELDELIDRGIFELTRDGNWQLKFVGSLVLRKSAWFCIPSIAASQFLSTSLEPKILLLLTRVLERYAKRSVDRVAVHDQIGTHLSTSEYAASPMRELELLLSLLEWTGTYGFHTTDVEHRATGTNRPIRWPDTINRTLPSHLRTSTVYIEPSSISVLRSPSIVGILQAQAILRLLSKYRTVMRSLADVSLDLVEEATTISEAQLPAHDLYELLHETNLDHEKELLVLLLALASIERARFTRDKKIDLYGTTAFELVWEDMCRVVFDSSSTPSEILSNPKYRLPRSTAEISIARQRPDVLCEHGDFVMVLDAKYYTRFPRLRPGLEDIRKQIFYAMSLPASTASLCAFLLPSVHPVDAEYVGSARMMLSSGPGESSIEVDERFPVVHCVGLPWNRMIDCYLNVKSPVALRNEVLDALLATTSTS